VQKRSEPKISGLSFNLFAIIALLVVLPVSVAFISNLAGANYSEYESVTRSHYEDTPAILDECSLYPERNMLMDWVDKGYNATQDYIEINTQLDDLDNNGIPDAQELKNYEGIWDDEGVGTQNGLEYYFMTQECIALGLTNPTVYPANIQFRNGEVFYVGIDNHYWPSVRVPGWHGYIGDSGDRFSFEINQNFFEYVDESKDLSKLKLTFIDYEYTFSCDSPVFQDISYKADIKFDYLTNFTQQEMSFNNFQFEKVNKYELRDFQGSLLFNSNGSAQEKGNVCHVSFVLEFVLDPFETMALNEMVNGDYSNLSAVIDIYDLDFDYTGVFVSIGNNQIGQNKAPIAILGDGAHAIKFEVAYTDTVKSNFWLNGGTFLLGGGLFALAIANTPYWNPVVNYFKKE
jgi:hypothetical protein